MRATDSISIMFVQHTSKEGKKERRQDTRTRWERRSRSQNAPQHILRKEYLRECLLAVLDLKQTELVLAYTRRRCTCACPPSTCARPAGALALPLAQITIPERPQEPPRRIEFLRVLHIGFERLAEGDELCRDRRKLARDHDDMEGTKNRGR